jgi:hypothetical protein
VSQHLSLLRHDRLVRARHVLEMLFAIFCKPDSMCEPPARQRKPRRSGRKP